MIIDADDIPTLYVGRIVGGYDWFVISKQRQFVTINIGLGFNYCLIRTKQLTDKKATFVGHMRHPPITKQRSTVNGQFTIHNKRLLFNRMKT